ncbi:hypothetical protein JZ751_029159 [Albula glossodonta]|uniref:Peptidase M12B domain-containing protein n=1 Tax=Albula glossodonta TaxID=121402 RepID=A0A8T2PGT2_9TELE|nr:hypothetical protein JZ751_029159 [Albula glossodonta]
MGFLNTMSLFLVGRRRTSLFILHPPQTRPSPLPVTPAQVCHCPAGHHVHQNGPLAIPSHQNLSSPNPSHQNLSSPNPSHQNLSSPNPSHQNLSSPNPSHQIDEKDGRGVSPPRGKKCKAALWDRPPPPAGAAPEWDWRKGNVVVFQMEALRGISQALDLVLKERERQGFFLCALLGNGLTTFKPFGPPAPNSILAPARRKNGIVRTIDRIYHGGGRVGYLIYMDDRKFQLDMEKDEALLSQHFNAKYLDALHGMSEGAKPLHRECVYRGTVDSKPESLALFNLCGGGLEGFFAVGQARYTVRPLIRAKGHENDVHALEDVVLEQTLHYYSREGFSFETMTAQEGCGTGEGRWRRYAAKKPHHREWEKTNTNTRTLGVDENERRTLSSQRWYSDIIPHSSGKRHKRSVSRARHVELLLVADQSMAKKYGKDLHHYLLTIASIASKLYGHASIENPIRLSVVKVVVLSEEEKGLEISKNAAATLKSFCKWQNQQNPLDDDHQQHHDAAILFTRQVNNSPG